MTIINTINSIPAIFSQIDVLNQMSGLFDLIDSDRVHIYCNESAASAYGYKKNDDAIGARMEDMPCKASESADVFAIQNNEVKEQGSKLKIIDIHPYVNDKVLTILTEKSPMYDTHENFICTIFHGTVINNSLLSKI